MKQLTLASGSRQRYRLLADHGFAFDVSVSDLDESRHAGESPSEMVLRLAISKATAVADPDRITLAADTVVVFEERVLGKPIDEQNAVSMLTRMSDSCHLVLTGWAVVTAGAPVASAVDSTLVTFRALTATEIQTYVASGEPMDKAGAYGIQGPAAQFLAAVEGSISNVAGLPMESVVPTLAKFGIIPSRAGDGQPAGGG